MHSSLTRKTFEKIYRMLDAVSPLDCDCGQLCGAACCTAGSGGDMGIYLLPGEEKVHDRHDSWMEWGKLRAEDYDFPSTWSGAVYFVRCKTPPHCPREKRPIQCRTFPLVPHIGRDGELTMVYNDLDLPYTCPLIEEEIPLNDDFVRVTQEAWERMIRDPLICDLVKMDSEQRESSILELLEKLGR